MPEAYRAPLPSFVHMWPLYTVAASFVPSAEEVIPYQFFSPTEVSSVHVAPLLLEVHILPLFITAASFVPSAEEVIPRNFCVCPNEFLSQSM